MCVGRVVSFIQRLATVPNLSKPFPPRSMDEWMWVADAPWRSGASQCDPSSVTGEGGARKPKYGLRIKRLPTFLLMSTAHPSV